MATESHARNQKVGKDREVKRTVTIRDLARELGIEPTELQKKLYNRKYIKKPADRWIWPVDHPDLDLIRIKFQPNKLVTVKQLAHELGIRAPQLRRILRREGTIKKPPGRWEWPIGHPDLEKIRAVVKERIEKKDKSWRG